MANTWFYLLLASILCTFSYSQKARTPRWPLPKTGRNLASGSTPRISQYRTYLKSLSSNERKEFSSDAQITFGTLGVNAEKIIVKFRDSDTENQVLSALNLKSPTRKFKNTKAVVLKIPKGQDNLELLAHLGALKEIEGVESAIPDYKIQIAKTPNDPRFDQQWDFHNMGEETPAGKGLLDADIDALEAWEVTTGSKNVIVGILDTGIDYTHPDLASNIWQNPGETGIDSNGNNKSQNGIDDDENGFIDDFRGWDFVNNDNDASDENGHGTHVAGTIGAIGNNGVGVSGINWEVSLVPLQIFDSSGSGDLSGAMAALDYATQMRFPITNNSWGGGDFSTEFENLLKENRDAGSLFIAAAGNNGSNNDLTPFYPANYQVENMISVAATDNKDRLASFSNYGKTKVHLAAPGVDIYSTSVMWGTYYYESGTSMASPHVAGAAALIKSIQPNWSYTQIKTKLLESVDEIITPEFMDKTITGGRLNLAKAVDGVPSPLPYRLTVKSASPVVGSTLGGTRITIQGTGFHSGTRVTLASKPCHSLQILSQLELNCVTSPSSIASLHNINILNPDGNKVTITGGFRYSTPPRVTAVIPALGALGGGSRISITGNQFATGARVKIGDRDCQDLQIPSSTQITCRLPDSVAGVYGVKVINRYGVESNENITFTYRSAPALSSVSPQRGSHSGGSLLTVSGMGFIDGATIQIGQHNCLEPRWVSLNQMTCVAPPLAAGTYHLRVTNPEGQSSSNSPAISFESIAPKWVQTRGGNCISVCNQRGLVSSASPEGAYCTSGEVVPASARGAISFSNGCKPNRACAAQGRVSGATQRAQFCYGPGQTKNNERTDITMGCYCRI